MKIELDAALAAHGIDLAAWHVLGVAVANAGVEQIFFADYAYRMCDGMKPSLPLSAFKDALANCFAKGWLELVTDDLLARQRAWERLLPSLTVHTACGCVVLTQAGTDVELAVNRDAGFRDRPCSGWNLDMDAGVATVLADTEQLCRDRVSELTSEPDFYLGPGARISEIGDPSATGAWMPRWYVTKPSGFQARVAFEGGGWDGLSELKGDGQLTRDP